MAGGLSAEPPRVQVTGRLLGAAGTVLAVAGVSGIGDAALLSVLAVAMLLGAMFIWLDYGFTGGFRALLMGRDGRTLGAAFVVPAVAALVVLPVGMLVEGYLAGAAYSITDVAAFPWVARHGWAEHDLANTPHVAGWHAHLAQRPAVQRSMAAPHGAILD